MRFGHVEFNTVMFQVEILQISLCPFTTGLLSEGCTGVFGLEIAKMSFRQVKQAMLENFEVPTLLMLSCV